ncbi:MAG: DNA cytosine methyltransferase [Acidobacteria bacterium]|nr:DNA cytosine methyltransferase [Acidobacteriota bacterium]
MIAVDFFCGAGGLTRGLLDAGVNVVLGIDCDEQCRLTYESNNPPANFFCADLWDLSVTELKRMIGRVASSELLLAGCAPCQPFTKQRHDGEDHEKRRDFALLVRFAEFVERFRPGQVVMENVPGLTEVGGFSSYRRLRKVLAENDYDVAEGVLDAKEFGVPQTRRRFVLIAIRGSRASLPRATHGPNRLAFETVRKAISNYPPIEVGETHPSIPNHSAAALSKLNVRRIRLTAPDGGDRRDWPKKLWLDCHGNEYSGHTDVYGRMWWDRPAPALTGRCNSLSNGRYGHPEQHRAISLREAARLQTFPDNYVFFGSSKHIASQIGNAVPVLLASAVGEQVLRH